MASSQHEESSREQTGNYLQFLEPRHIEMYQTDWMPEKAGYKPATNNNFTMSLLGKRQTVPT